MIGSLIGGILIGAAVGTFVLGPVMQKHHEKNLAKQKEAKPAIKKS